MLSTLHPSPAGWLLPAMEDRREWLALSMGGDASPGDPGYRILLLEEISLVREVGRQLDPGGLVVATGERSLRAWELMTGREASL